MLCVLFAVPAQSDDVDMVQDGTLLTLIWPTFWLVSTVTKHSVRMAFLPLSYVLQHLHDIISASISRRRFPVPWKGLSEVTLQRCACCLARAAPVTYRVTTRVGRSGRWWCSRKPLWLRMHTPVVSVLGCIVTHEACRNHVGVTCACTCACAACAVSVVLPVKQTYTLSYGACG